MLIYLQLFWTFFKIGAFTFGGGMAMLPLMQEEVIAHGWLSEEEVINFVAVSESTPGPFAINMATYVGVETAGILGSVCATSGVVLPSFIVILLVAKFFAAFKENKIVKGCMTGLKPAAIGMIAAALVSTGITVFFPEGFVMQNMISAGFIGSLLIFVGMFLLSIKKVHPIIIVVISAVAGIGIGCVFGI